MDFLGLKTLTIIQEAVEWVEKLHGVKLDVATLPMDDEKTFNLLNKTNFGNPNSNRSSGAFGTITTLNGSAREIQLALRLAF
ncbi:MAG: hypothetical protein MUC42_17560 [Bryobacter sp.]|nr:hypothetical protein [Bryobacter sp.]